MALDRFADKSVDPAAQQMLAVAEQCGVSTAFTRADSLKPCPIGRNGSCCDLCYMGPCRFVPRGGVEPVGICGATHGTITARNFSRSIAAGTASHSDHGRDLAFTLKAVGRGEAKDYSIKEPQKLERMAGYLGVDAKGKTTGQLAEAVADKVLEQFGQQSGEIAYASRATKRRQALWRKLGMIPRGIDREVVETLHRTHVGNDQSPKHLLDHALRTALADGWGGSMMATDMTDILFGTPKPVRSAANLGVLKADRVNVLVHGHEPTLSEALVVASREPELIAYAKSKGAKGINLCGICCTSNEILMRQGIPAAGNFLHQELAILTGAVESMVVDVQCIMNALGPLTERYHTKLITTSRKAEIAGAAHYEFEPNNALEVARQIIRDAIDNYPNRRGEVQIPNQSRELIGGFSHEYIRYMQGGTYRASFRPLNDAIIAGRVRGLAGVVGCNNPRVTQDSAHLKIVEELIRNDVLVVMTGCGALAAGKRGLLSPETMDQAGKGLKEVCEAIGIPPILHLGSCVDNSRILTILTEVAEEGGVGEDIDEIPAVGIAPEWMSEKALAIGAYFVASGAYVLFGVDSPVEGSKEVTQLISSGWEAKVGGKLEFEPDVDKLIEKSLAHIDLKRQALKLTPWDPNRYGQSGDDRVLEALAL
jgi:anaerobic carbon-monoxide dehydrogenase catalytic subunit